MGRTKKQTELPGLEKPKIPELDTLLETYAEKASALSEARHALGELKAKIIEVAGKAGVTVYRDDTANPPLVLTLSTQDVKVKVTAGAPDFNDEDEGDDE